jgi:hypothetical protein
MNFRKELVMRICKKKKIVYNGAYAQEFVIFFHKEFVNLVIPNWGMKFLFICLLIIGDC